MYCEITEQRGMLISCRPDELIVGSLTTKTRHEVESGGLRHGKYKYNLVSCRPLIP